MKKIKPFYGICKTSIDYIIYCYYYSSLVLIISLREAKTEKKKFNETLCVIERVQYNIHKIKKSFWYFTLNAFSRQSSAFFPPYFLRNWEKQSKKTLFLMFNDFVDSIDLQIWLKHGILYIVQARCWCNFNGN